MRAKLLIFSVLLVALTAGWFVERLAATRLAAQLGSLRFQHRELPALRAERNRLRSLLPDPIRVASLRQTADERDKQVRQSDPTAQPVSASRLFSLGEWSPCASWGNQGQLTARTTVETLLWAAAGGDLMALGSLLEFDEVTRGKAAALHASLPPLSRTSFGTPEDLIAGILVSKVPLTEAQVSWFHQSDSDHASVAVLLAFSQGSPIAASTEPARSPANAPPALPENLTRKLAVLTLHRTSAGWRVIVPQTAIDRIARELGGDAQTSIR